MKSKPRCRYCNEVFNSYIDSLSHVCLNSFYKKLWKHGKIKKCDRKNLKLFKV
jgi:hypothetical protein